MPYRYAWLFILALIAATVFAFWRTYFGMLATAPMGFHVHGITASLWLLLLLAQSWTSHHGLALHRSLGRATFVAVPLFAAGAMGVIHSMAAGTAGGDPFYALWGAPLGVLDVIAFIAVLYAAGMALRHRREVRLHAGYMLSTTMFLAGPILGRVVNRTVPGLIVHGPSDFPIFGWGVQLANLVTVLIAGWLWQRDRRHGRPWAIALAVVVVQAVALPVVGASGAARTAFAVVGTWPLAAMMAFGFAAGAAAVAIGWNAPATRRRLRPVTA